MEFRRPFRGHELLQRTGPFAVTATLAFLIALLPLGSVRLQPLAIAAFINFATFGAALLLATERFPRAFDIAPALIFAVGVGFLRDALGGAGSGYEGLIVLPVLWGAVYGTVRQLTVVVAMASLVLAAPMVLVAGDRYPPDAWRSALLWIAIASVIGLAVHRLVGRIQSLVRADATTGLPNARAMARELSRELARYRRDNERLSIALLNIDGLGRLNSEQGYRHADAMLQQCVAGWNTCLRATDGLGLWSDGEFLLLLPACYVEHASWVVERMQRTMPDGLTCSAGLLSWDGRVSEHELIAQAELLLAEARRHGPGRFTVGLVDELEAVAG